MKKNKDQMKFSKIYNKKLPNILYKDLIMVFIIRRIKSIQVFLV
jgi:hypothetical protein